MNTKSRGRDEISATTSRNFRTFLLLSQLESQEIGQRLAKARREAGMTQEEVADLVGVSTRSWQGYEAGDVVPYRHFKNLAGILNRPIEWFLHGDESESADRLALIEAELRAIRETQETELRHVREQLEVVRALGPAVDRVLDLVREMQAGPPGKTGTGEGR